MKRALTVAGCLCLTLCLISCAGRESLNTPPTVLRVPQYLPLPPQCLAIHPLNLESGATSEDVEEAQHLLILQYEGQLRACRDLIAGIKNQSGTVPDSSH